MKNPLKIIILTITLISFSYNVSAQEKILSKTIKEIRKDIISMCCETENNEISETKFLPILLDGKPQSFKSLEKYSFENIEEITISFDKKITPIYGYNGSKGVIFIKTKEKEKEKEIEKEKE